MIVAIDSILEYCTIEAILDSELLHRINVGGRKVAAIDGLMNWSKDSNADPSSYRVSNGGSDIYRRTDADTDISHDSLFGIVPEEIFQWY